MKRIFSILFTAFCAIALTGASAEVAEAASVKNRQVRQQKRIGQGVRSGELTRPETRRLQRNATRIRRSTRRDRIDGGVFTARERGAIATQAQPPKPRDPAARRPTGQSRCLRFSPGEERKCVKGLSERGARRLSRTGVLDCTSSGASRRRLATTSERNNAMAGLARAFARDW